MNDTPSGWHLDKKVPITIAASIALQTATMIWWASGVEHRLQNAEQLQSEQKIIINTIQTERQAGLQRLSKVEQAVGDIREFMARIDMKLDRLGETRR